MNDKYDISSLLARATLCSSPYIVNFIKASLLEVDSVLNLEPGNLDSKKVAKYKIDKWDSFRFEG